MRIQKDYSPIKKTNEKESYYCSSRYPFARLHWGWIATPAAAVIGLFIHKPTEPAQDFVVPVAAAETAGQNILDDGTDYALFVRM